MSVSLTIADPDAMERLGALLAEQLGAGDVLLLTGELGAGKTTLTRGLGAALGVRGAVTSPTFVLARTHPRPDAPPLVHVDAYRLRDAAELDDLDLDFAGSIVVVEWGAGLLEHLVDEWLAVTIERPSGAGEGTAATTDDDSAPDPDAAPIEPRTVTITGVGARWADLGWLHAARD
ncbi:tRNA (adenosine(37)-N6)-threonylcarbamoyltransferase complex ATPase subunit type 1 TsaE [Microcella humidisoli]|jgi:tRNA threonylcarbamoyl adenosine modification protein YjeE|uniref:tRNA threonylcarbamoyladenosine biosynthesis protein TsaE n=1 Tax=Microcella humidisoli TaxID=2963406 RepID=A0ABY5FUB6_9MICO|nr:tRNA (adenosine(37)-N6)-threonylcarbamoyltransferase complex ATPase subunit type 1 TsaE [Microcella humidisoli]UTT61401.1 tRNA (adenosine(37)-N6)-threonylcarbamoyltransferase complex ATPase subunit type 1 TsaE [Microcella humidisoli]